MNSESRSANPVVKAVIEGTAPRPAQVAAARGILPLPHNDLLEVLVAFANSQDTELSGHAQHTLTMQDSLILQSSITSADVSEAVLDYFAGLESVSKEVHVSIITNSRTPPSAVLKLVCKTKDADLIDRVSLNQQLLIQTPAIIDAIANNPHRSAEADRRVAETKREFFEKERGQEQIVSELRAQGKEAAAEFIEKSDFSTSEMSAEDALFIAEHVVVPDSETDDSWMGLEFIEEIYEETPEQRQAVFDKIMGEFKVEDMDLPSERISIINRIIKMGMKDRARLAAKGDRESRNILIRDPNRIVAQAVMTNPRITEQEIEKIAGMRTVSEDILRQIAISRQWNRNYQVVHNLAKNPRSPIANVLNILSRLQLRDLSALSKNKNVSDAIRRHALRLAHARAGR